MSRDWCAKWRRVEVDPEALAVADRVERLPRGDEVVGDLGRVHLEPEPDALGVEDVDDRRPALGEVLVAALDLGEVVRREGVEHVPDRRAGEAVHLLDAEPRRRPRRVLHPLGRALPDALRIAVAPDLRRQDPVVARRRSGRRPPARRGARRARSSSGGCARGSPGCGRRSRPRRAPGRPRSGRPSRRARGRRSPSRPAFSASSSSGRSAHWPVKRVTGLAIGAILRCIGSRRDRSRPRDRPGRRIGALPVAVGEHQLHRRPCVPGRRRPSSSASRASRRGRVWRRGRRAAISTSTRRRYSSATATSPSARAAATSARSASKRPTGARRSATAARSTWARSAARPPTAGVTCRYKTAPRVGFLIAREHYTLYRR